MSEQKVFDGSCVYLPKADLLKRVGRMDQLARIQRYQLEDGPGRGMRVLEVSTGGGLAFSVYPDKGLDIGPASFNGLALSWCTPNGFVNPAFYDASGIAWLRTWQGGLLTTCGLINVGSPCVTPEGDQGLHGRMHHSPAEEINTHTGWNEAGDYELVISGKIGISCVFGEKLVTTRTIRTVLGAHWLEVVDRTENLGYDSKPFMKLLHMNFGYPLVDECSVLEAPDHPVTTRFEKSRQNIANWSTMLPPTHGFAEEVFDHDLPVDENGFAAITLRNPKRGLGVKVAYRKKELPWLMQWKMMGEGEYVTGLEPANCFTEGQCADSKRGVLRHIEPGETIETVVRVTVC